MSRTKGSLNKHKKEKPVKEKKKEVAQVNNINIKNKIKNK